MDWEEFKNFLKDKVFLIGISFIDENNELIEQYQTSGKVLELTDDGMIKLTRDDKGIFQIPYDIETMTEAEKGEYHEASTGKIVINPDYISTWEIAVSNQNHINEIKQFGFIG